MTNRLIAGLVFYLVAFFGTLFYSTLIISLTLVPGLGDRRRIILGNRLAGMWGRTLFGAVPGWKVRTEGLENLPGPDSAVVMVANHESMIDIPVMYYLRVIFCWLSKASVLEVPILGAAMRVSGQIPIVRGNRKSHEAALQTSADRLKNGFNMFFFPEGTRSEVAGTMRTFKIGAFKLADEADVAILPIALSGTGKLWPKRGKLPQNAAITIKVLPKTKKLEHETLEAYAARVRGLIESELNAMTQASG